MRGERGVPQQALKTGILPVVLREWVHVCVWFKAPSFAWGISPVDHSKKQPWWVFEGCSSSYISHQVISKKRLMLCTQAAVLLCRWKSVESLYHPFLYGWPIKESTFHFPVARSTDSRTMIQKIHTWMTQSDHFGSSHMHNISFTCCSLIKRLSRRAWQRLTQYTL